MIHKRTILRRLDGWDHRARPDQKHQLPRWSPAFFHQLPRSPTPLLLARSESDPPGIGDEQSVQGRCHFGATGIFGFRQNHSCKHALVNQFIEHIVTGTNLSPSSAHGHAPLLLAEFPRPRFLAMKFILLRLRKQQTSLRFARNAAQLCKRSLVTHERGFVRSRGSG